MSQEQSGGTTAKNIESKSTKKKRVTIFAVIACFAAIVTILHYFGIDPKKGDDVMKKDDAEKELKADRNVEDEEQKESISVGDVAGDVVISQGQEGGITAKNVKINTDRRLNQDNFDALVNGLSENRCEITVGVLGMGGEQGFLADQLLLAAKKAGCNVSGVNHGIGFAPFVGLQLKYSPIDTPDKSISIIEDVLRNANISYTRVDDNSQSSGAIYLYVGYKP